MSGVGWLLIAAGLLFAAVSWGLTRASRLTFGQGALWVLAGGLLALIGLLRGGIAALMRAAGVPDPDVALLAALLVLLLAVLMDQAVRHARASMRLRRLGAEHALLAAEERAPGGPPRSPLS